MTEPKKVAIYARVSTRDKQEADNQLLELREFCRKQGWEISREYIDKVSGGSKDKPQFKRMMDDAHMKKFDIVLFWALDRLTREGVSATLNYLKELDGYDIAWHSYTERYLTSALGEFKDVVIAVLAAIAKQEKVRIRERVIAGLERAKAEGWKKTGRAGGRPKIEDDAFKVAEVAKLKAQGLSIRKIAAQMKISPNSVIKLMDAA